MKRNTTQVGLDVHIKVLKQRIISIQSRESQKRVSVLDLRACWNQMDEALVRRDVAAQRMIQGGRAVVHGHFKRVEEPVDNVNEIAGNRVNERAPASVKAVGLTRVFGVCPFHHVKVAIDACQPKHCSGTGVITRTLFRHQAVTQKQRTDFHGTEIAALRRLVQRLSLGVHRKKIKCDSCEDLSTRRRDGRALKNEVGPND